MTPFSVAHHFSYIVRGNIFFHLICCNRKIISYIVVTDDYSKLFCLIGYMNYTFCTP